MNRRTWLKTSVCWSAAALLSAGCAPLIANRSSADQDQFGDELDDKFGGALDARGLRPVPSLPPGGIIGLIAPAGPAADQVDQGAAWLAARGYQTRIFPGCRANVPAATPAATPYLAGDDTTRLRDLHTAFADPEVDAILCLRGGYGTMRLLPQIDFDLLRANPKPFIGYSDITALHLALNRYAGFVTFHGPMLVSDLAAGKQEPTESALFAMLEGRLGRGALLTQPAAYPLATLNGGSASGRLAGGNLSMLCATLDTPYEIDTRGTILFIEDINEAPYQIDRMLTQLRLSGKLNRLRGVLLGEFTDIGNDAAGGQINEAILLPLFREIFLPLGVPVLSGWRSGHGDPNLTLPLGARVTLDADHQQIRLEQNVVVQRTDKKPG
jgi:muramoyltetrapeptide carboxypeptidase